MVAVDPVHEPAAAAVQRTAAGNPVLAGYVVGDVDPALVRAQVAEWLPDGIVPLIVPVEDAAASPWARFRWCTAVSAAASSVRPGACTPLA